MNTNAAQWTCMDFDQRMQWLEFEAWQNARNWAHRKARSLAGERTFKKTHTDIIPSAGGMDNVDRFRNVEQPEPVTCDCAYCGDELAEGMDVLNTDSGVFCDYRCFGRYIAKEEGYRKEPLTADMVG